MGRERGLRWGGGEDCVWNVIYDRRIKILKIKKKETKSKGRKYPLMISQTTQTKDIWVIFILVSASECTGTCLLRSEGNFWDLVFVFDCTEAGRVSPVSAATCCTVYSGRWPGSFWATLSSPPHALPHKYWDYRSPPSH